MKHLQVFASIVSMMAFVTANAQDKSAAPQLGKDPVKAVIAAMTTEEKAHMVVGMGMRFPGSNNGTAIGQTEDKVPGAAGTTYAIPRLGIPAMVLADGPAGLRINPIRQKDSSKTYYATAWPVATLLASTWDTALVRKVGQGFGNEVHEYGVDIVLAPALNIHRNPLGGRNFEYYSEDPLVAGSMAAAMVNGIQSNGVGTSIKHFAANNQETNRNTVNTVATERALREIYLRAFQYTVEKSSPWTVMSSYNKINGTYTSESRDLLTTILRDEWHFRGFVMTDWFGGKDPVAQMQAGNDLLEPGTPQQVQHILDAVAHDSLDIKVLDQNIERILNLLVESPAFRSYRFSNHPDLKAHAQLSRNAAAEGMVLLENKNAALPVKNLKRVALFGNTSYDPIAGGTGSGDVNKAYSVSLAQGLSLAGIDVNPMIQHDYSEYLSAQKALHPRPRFAMGYVKPIDELSLTAEQLNSAAGAADAAIVTIGRNAGEGADRKLENDFYLTAQERSMLQDIAGAFHAKGKKVIVVLNIGGVIEINSWKDQADAIVLAWQPGLEGGNAITDVLTGKVNPSGRLATTFPMDYKDVPSAQSFPGKEFPDQATGTGFRRQVPAVVSYEEGIYVGYRYYNTFHVKPAYEFGYGLSYTTFSFSPIKLSSNNFNGKIMATVTVTNSGKVAGKEVAQLYLHAPAGTVDKPEEELKGFAKTGLLAPGKSQTITFVLSPRDLASFHTDREAWIAEPGTYTLKLGASSLDIRQNASFRVLKETVTEHVHKALAPKEPVNELKSSQSKAL